MKWRVIILILCGIASSVQGRFVGAQQAPPPSDDDVYWDDRFYPPSSPSISGMTAGPDGTIYVTGDFNQIGGVLARGVAAWDGSDWSAVPGASSSYGRRALASDGGDQLYADGPGGVAHWDGSNWTLRAGLGETPNTIAVAQDGAVYAGGGGTRVNPVFPYETLRYGFGVKRWGSGSWESVGSDLLVVRNLSLGPSGALFAVAADESTCIWESCVWRLEGSAWTRIGDLRLELDPFGHLAVNAQGDIFVSGQVLNEADNPSGVARWDGSSWSIIKSGAATDYLGLDPTGQLHAAFREGDGRVRIEKYGSQGWEIVDDQLVVGGGVSLAFGDDSVLIAGGSFSGPNGVRNLARLEGRVWLDIGAPGLGVDGPVEDIIATEDGNLLMAGEFSRAGGLDVPGLVEWDSTEWRRTIAEPPGPVYARAVGPDGIRWVSGQLEIDGVRYNLARHDGTRWVGVVDTLTKDSGLNGPRIQHMVLDANGHVYVTGNFSAIAGVAVNRIARWDGYQWYPLGGGLGEGEVSSMVFDPAGDLYVGGGFHEAGGLVANGVARWDGETWYALGSGLSDSPDQHLVRAMALDGNTLYVGGSFGTAGGRTANHIASWDGERWAPLEDGLNETVSALAAGPDGDLFVGGKFLWASQVRASRIARWTGNRWEALGTGLLADGETEYTGPHAINISAIAFDKQGALMIGGRGIGASGGVAASGISRWLKPTGIVIEPPVEEPEAHGVAVSIYPNPQIGYATAVVSLGTEQQVLIDVHDALGRQIALLYDGMLNADVHEVLLDTRSWPAGLYILRVIGETGQADRSFVHVR